MTIINHSVLVVGSGAAGLNAADCLASNGVTDVAVLTEGLYASTSLNTGSDKQTYYKLSTTGGEPDSVYDMAKTYYDCGGIEGFHALREAAMSLQCFFKLVEAGVPFPTNEYGEYVGYRTDHDARKRATSAGPLTSKFMAEALIARVKEKKIPVYEPYRAVKLLARGGRVRGLVAIREDDASFTVFSADYIVFAVGGPAGIYADSVYPVCQTGGIGAPLEAGATAVNLNEWQYGLASTGFRWNLSGSYQQVIPTYVSMDDDGNLREFLPDYLGKDACSLVFGKGYHWPFSPNSLGETDRSSLVDLAVYTESTVKHRKVFFDYRRNPKDFDPAALSPEARAFLEEGGLATLATPVERLRKLNEKAYRLYRDHGIDLEEQPLAVAVCAQHCNGGLSVDKDYQTTIGGLYACGECAGVFGAARPGGSALNDTQVSSLAASLAIAAERKTADMTGFEAEAAAALAELEALKTAFTREKSDSLPPEAFRLTFAGEMSAHAAFLREKPALAALRKRLDDLWNDLASRVTAATPYDIVRAFTCRDLLLTARAVAASEEAYAEAIGGSRGGFLEVADGETPFEAAKTPRLCADKSRVIRVALADGAFRPSVHTVSPLPQSGQWFETYLAAVKA